MYICMYIYICVHTLLYIHIYIYEYKYIYTYYIYTDSSWCPHGHGPDREFQEYEFYISVNSGNSRCHQPWIPWIHNALPWIPRILWIPKCLNHEFHELVDPMICLQVGLKYAIYAFSDSKYSNNNPCDQLAQVLLRPWLEWIGPCHGYSSWMRMWMWIWICIDELSAIASWWIFWNSLKPDNSIWSNDHILHHTCLQWIS